eukprot:jgi/Tetstr1/422530/TSEL_013340.t1
MAPARCHAAAKRVPLVALLITIATVNFASASRSHWGVGGRLEVFGVGGRALLQGTREAELPVDKLRSFVANEVPIGEVDGVEQGQQKAKPKQKEDVTPGIAGLRNDEEVWVGEDEGEEHVTAAQDTPVALAKRNLRPQAGRRYMLSASRDRLPMSLSTSWSDYKAALLAKDADITSQARLPAGWEWDEYHTVAEIKQLFDVLEATFPDIVDTFSIGMSNQKRPMYAIKIGAQQQLASNASEVKLVGSMHGDESAACEMLLRLAWDLCRRYTYPDEDTLDIRNLLLTTNIYILPTMNPDGYDARPRTRENANGRDLNRSFPRLGSTAGSSPGRLQPEVEAMIGWTKTHNFPLSANLHGGALVASYPFDACDRSGFKRYCPTPEDPTPYNLARTIADSNLRMSASSAFPEGVTRGSEWYAVIGGMQDWVWYATQGTELTIEVHEDKEPDAWYRKRLPWLYLEMRDPLLHYARSVHHSFKGTVVMEGTGTPVDSEVQLTRLPRGGSQSSSGRKTLSTPKKGTFTRVLTAGVQYCFRIAAEGVEAQWGVLELAAGLPKVASSSIVAHFTMTRQARGVHFLGEAAKYSEADKQSTRQRCAAAL